jgi:hypothetical protein
MLMAYESRAMGAKPRQDRKLRSHALGPSRDCSKCPSTHLPTLEYPVNCHPPDVLSTFRRARAPPRAMGGVPRGHQRGVKEDGGGAGEHVVEGAGHQRVGLGLGPGYILLAMS